MSDPQQPTGESAADDHEGVEDVVGSAHEGLAEAEAAGRDAVAGDSAGRDVPASDASAQPEAPHSPEDTPVADAVAGEAAPAADAPAPDASESASSESDAPAPDAPESGPHTDASPWSEPAPEPEPEPAAAVTDRTADGAEQTPTPAAAADVRAAEASEATASTIPAAASDAAVVDAGVEPTTVDAAQDPVAAPVGEEPAVATRAQQPIFVQAPEEPRPRGNRGAAGGVGVLAALSFAILYLVAWLLIGFATGDVTPADAGDALLGELGTWGLWVPVVVFFLAFWLLGAIINRGRWGAWVIFGLLVGLASYGGHLLGQLFDAPFWMISTAEGVTLVQDQLFAPLAVAALVIGRELTIWFGAWIAARGRRMSELNVEARREYERTLEAGPQLAR